MPPFGRLWGFYALHREAYQLQGNAQKAHLCGKTTQDVHRQNRSTVRPMRVMREPKNSNKKKKLYSGKLGTGPDHPRCRIEIKFWLGNLGSLRGRSKFQVSSIIG